MTECQHGDDPAICPPCNGPPPAPPREWGRPFYANYEGRCRGCGLFIRVGDMIRRCDDEYRHADAACLTRG